MKRVFDSIELVPTMEAEASRYSTLLIPWIQNYALIQDFETSFLWKVSPKVLNWFYRVPTVREKSVKNEKSSRSGKSQGILS